MLNTNFEMEKTMGSKISIQDIDQKASDFAKANFMKQLKEHHQNLEKENKHFKEANANLQRQLDEESKLWSELKNENKELKEKNKDLKEEIEILKGIRDMDFEELQEYEKEREKILLDCQKLKELVDKLREAIEEPKELDDK